MAIKGLTDRPRLNRLGKVRLGVLDPKGYPKSTNFFVCPQEIKDKYGEEPRELDILLCSNDIQVLFPVFYKRYGSGAGLKCKGDGENATCVGPSGEFEEIQCLGMECEFYKSEECHPVGTLSFMLPEVDGLGIWQLTTSSFLSIQNINSFLLMLHTITKGKIAMLPLKLIVQIEEVQSKGTKFKVPIVHLHAENFNLREYLEQTRTKPALPPPSIVETLTENKTEDAKVAEPKKAEDDKGSGMTAGEMVVQRIDMMWQELKHKSQKTDGDLRADLYKKFKIVSTTPRDGRHASQIIDALTTMIEEYGKQKKDEIPY